MKQRNKINQMYLILAAEVIGDFNTGPAYARVPLSDDLWATVARRLRYAQHTRDKDPAFHQTEYIDSADELQVRWLEAVVLEGHHAIMAALKDNCMVVVDADPLGGNPGYEVESANMLVNATDVCWEATDGNALIVTAQISLEQLSAFQCGEAEIFRLGV